MHLKSIATYQEIFIISQFILVQILGAAGCSWLSVSFAIALVAGAVSSEGLTGAGGSLSKKLTHMVGSWVGVLAEDLPLPSLGPSSYKTE